MGSKTDTPGYMVRSVLGACWFFAAVGCSQGPRVVAPDPVLDLPARSATAVGGAAVADALIGLDLETREARIAAEVRAGNVPPNMRSLMPVFLVGSVDGSRVTATVWVTRDYLAVGADDDAFYVPVSPRIAQQLADDLGCGLPTTALVDAVWAAATVRLEPRPIPPSDAMTTVPVFVDHNRTVRAQLAEVGATADDLVAGNKKDVVVWEGIQDATARVGIYGWHRLDGKPIQPLYAGHTEQWVDYSHGIRLVHRSIEVNGTRRDLWDALADPTVAPVLTGGGIIEEPYYAVAGR